MHKFIAHQYTHPSTSPSVSVLASGSASASAAVSRRSACDRCRAQKLRCIRDAGAASTTEPKGAGGCRRCLKMGTDCTTTTAAAASSKRNVKKGAQRQHVDTTSTSDTEKHTLGGPDAITDNWVSWDLPISDSNSEMQNFNDHNNNNDYGQAGLDIDMFPAAADDGGIGFQIFDPMLFEDNTLLFHETAIQPTQKEHTANNKKEEERKGKEEEEITIHTIASTLDSYLHQLNAGPPEITLFKILFTTSPTENEKGNCHRAHTMDDILQWTTHFINILKTNPPHHPTGKGTGGVSTESLLRMLAIYTTILKLFLIIFGHVHIFLREGIASSTTGSMAPSNKAAAIQPVPDVQFDGLDIRTSTLL